MLLPSALCDGGIIHRATSSTSSLRSTSSPVPGHSRRSTTSSSRMPQSQNNLTLAPPAITISAALSLSNDRPSGANEGHISSLLSSVRPGASSASRAAGILTTCKRLHQILSLDTTSRIANGGVLGCASGLTPQPSIERDVPIARTPSPAVQALLPPSTPKRRRTTTNNLAPNAPKPNAKARATRSTSMQTIRTVSSSSLKVVVTASQAPSTPKRPQIVRIPKTPMRRNKRRRAIGGAGECSDEDDKFYPLPIQRRNALLNRNYAINPSTPHKRTRVTTAADARPRELVFGPLIGAGETEAAPAVPRTRRRAVTTSSHSISRPMQASRIYNQRTQAQDGSSGAYVNRAAHSRVRSMADAFTMSTGRRLSDVTLNGPSLLPPDEFTDADDPVPPIPVHYPSSPNTNALSNLSLNSPQATRQRDPDAMDITLPTTVISSTNLNTPSTRRWTHQEDRQLVEVILQKLHLTQKDLEECAKMLGKDTKTVEVRWEKMVKKLADSGKLNMGTTGNESGINGSTGVSPLGVNTPNGRKFLRRTTKRIQERRMSAPEGSFKENM